MGGTRFGSWASGVKRGAWTGWLRLSVLGGFFGVMLLPVGEVYSNHFPMIRRFHIEGNDLQWISGRGAPHQRYHLWIRQRSFKEDDHIPMNFNCPNNTDDWTQYVTTGFADGKGNFTIQDLDLMVLPPGVGNENCTAGLFTEFLVGWGATENQVPKLHMFNVPNYLWNQPQEFVEVDVENAFQVGVAITDGPNDTATAFGGVDMDEDGIDLCDHPGFDCGERVSFLGSGGTFSSPAIVEHDASIFSIPAPMVDDEYHYILSMAEAHGDGASFLAAAKTARADDTLGPSIDVDVDIFGKIDFNCNGGLFDFPL
jgi:hypothetical protein